MGKSPKIVIAGASGYIGQALIPELLKRFPDAEITAFSRLDQTSEDPRITWKACDLFSLRSLEAAIPKQVDLAFYLVHSMGPTAHLDQGSFADYDLILADNFARILQPTGLRQLIYLGGLIPDSKDLSLHLQSRLEVEETFFESRLPTTVFRAGLIIGEAGSSFQILTNLVARLPVMLCPRWTQTLTTPVDLATVVRSLVQASLLESAFNRIFDLAGSESLTYVDMMRVTARKMGKRRIFLGVPFFTPTLSRLWVSLITGASKTLVYPLVASLEHEMVARPSFLFEPPHPGHTYADLLKNVRIVTTTRKRTKPFVVQRKTVRSVQRLPLAPNRNAEWVKDQYIRWLPKFLSPLIKVGVTGTNVQFAIFMSRVVLLDLDLNNERSSPDRQLLYITGGLLASEGSKGRLEFRVVLRRKFVLAAIHEFRPSLPWYFYRYSQAVVHLWVMKNFGRYLSKRMNVRATV